MVWGSKKLIIAIVCFIGCNKASNEPKKITFKVENTVKERKMDEYEIILSKNGFKFPTDDIYKSKIKHFFGLDIQNNTNISEIEIIPRGYVSNESTFYPIAIVNKKYIYWAQDEEWDDMAFVYLNKYIFYNDKIALTYLKLKDRNSYLSNLVSDFGYSEDEELIKYMFNNAKGNLKDYVTIFFGRNGINGNLQLRKELLNEYLKYNPNVDIPEMLFISRIIDSKNDNYIANYEGNRYEDSAFILEKILIQVKKDENTLMSGSVDYILKHYPDFLAILKEKKAFNNSLLKEYMDGANISE